MEKFKQLDKSLQKEIDKTGWVIRNGDMVTYRRIVHEGDLPGDMGLEWWTQEDWDRHAKHVEELKAKGTYGKPWICDMTLKDFPEYDRPFHPVSGKPLESYRFKLIDLSGKGEDKIIDI